MESEHGGGKRPGPTSPGAPATPPKQGLTKRWSRVAAGLRSKRFSYESRLQISLAAFTLPAVLLAAAITWKFTASTELTGATAIAGLLLSRYAAGKVFRQITRPLTTLASVVAALQADDFSFRSGGAQRGDSLGDLALEINALATTLQGQRAATRDALTLAERVMESMRTPVLAFTGSGDLCLLNPAAESAFFLDRGRDVGRTAVELGLASLFEQRDSAIYAQPAVSGVAGETRWSLRRSTFRLRGIPHELFVLSDVQEALRAEEGLAWRRLIRVLSHEINNSLTPITSIAASLRTRLSPAAASNSPSRPELMSQDLERGLQLIEERALSLHLFLQAYQQLTRLPSPSLQDVSLGDLLQRVSSLETRIAVGLRFGPPLELRVDPAQMEQLLINLLRNGVDAALSLAHEEHTPSVFLSWSATAAEVTLRVEDNGPGLADTANLFVPFYTTKPNGTGVGLALAKQIASAHNGTLTLTNREGASGCIAQLHLPLRS